MLSLLPRALTLGATDPRKRQVCEAPPSYRDCSYDAKGLLEEILRLPVEERLDLLEQVWESIAADPSKVPVPEWHIAELDRRLADPNPERLTWDEVKCRFFPPQ